MTPRLRQLLDEVSYLHDALQVHRDRLAREARCTRAQWAALSVLGQGESVPRIARRLGLSRQSVQRTADSLVAASFAEYVPNPHHRRSPILSPTEQGRRILDRLERSIERSYGPLGDGLNDEELDGALLVLRALRDDVERV